MPTINAGASATVALLAGQALAVNFGDGVAQITPPLPASVAPTSVAIRGGLSIGPFDFDVALFLTASQLTDYEIRTAFDVLDRSGRSVGARLVVPTLADLQALAGRQQLIVGATYVVGLSSYLAITRASFTEVSQVAGANQRVMTADVSFAGVGGDADAYLNALFLTASQAYSTSLGRVRVVVPAGVWVIQRLFWRENVEYDFRGAIFQAHPTLGNTTGPMAACVRSFIGGTWYGRHRNIRIVGGTFIPNNLAGTANIVFMDEFEDSEVIDITIQHQPLRTGWALPFSGRRCKIINPTILNGTEVFQDGVHLTHGNNITVIGGSIDSGDDACVCGIDISPGVDFDDEALSEVTWTGTVVNARRGFGVSLYFGQDTAALGGVNRRRLRNITINGIVGSAGVVRNGGIRVVDTSSAGNPGTDNTVIRGVTVEAKLRVGDATHDGSQAFAVHVTTGQRVTIESDLTLTDTTGGATRFRPLFVQAGLDLEFKIRQTGLVGLSSRFLPFSASHTISGYRLNNCDLSAANVASGNAVEIQNGNNGVLDRGEVCGGVFREIPNGGYGVLAQGLNSVGALSIVGARFIEQSGATSSSGYNSSTSGIVSHIIMTGNDFSAVDSGSPGNLFAANHASFFVDGNRGFPSKQAGTVTLTAASTTATITIASASVRFSTLTSPADTQVTVRPTNAAARATPVSVSLASATTATITSTAAPGSDATYSWVVDNSRKPV